MLWMLFACAGGSKGPIDLPELEVRTDTSGVEDPCDPDHQPFLAADGEEGVAVNGADRERELTIEDLEEPVDDVWPDADFILEPPEVTTQMAATKLDEIENFDSNVQTVVLEPGGEAVIKPSVKLYCRDGEAPTGTHRAELVLSSVDTAGGDLVLQALEIVVVID